MEKGWLLMVTVGLFCLEQPGNSKTCCQEPSCVMTNDFNFFVRYPRESLDLTNYKIVSEIELSNSSVFLHVEACGFELFKNAQSMIRCAVKYQNKNHFIELYVFDKRDNRDRLVATKFWSLQENMRCDCPDIKPPGLLVRSKEGGGLTNNFQSYKIKVDFSFLRRKGLTTSECTAFVGNNQTVDCLTTSILLKNFDICEVGEICVRYDFFQCRSKSYTKCTNYLSLLDHRDDIVDNMQCSIENGRLSASWSSLKTKEIKSFKYNISATGRNIRWNGTTTAKEVILDTGFKENVSISIVPCMRCKCLSPKLFTCKAVQSSLRNPDDDENIKMFIPIVAALAVLTATVVIMIIVLIVKRKRNRRRPPPPPQRPTIGNGVRQQDIGGHQDFYLQADPIYEEVDDHPLKDIVENQLAFHYYERARDIADLDLQQLSRPYIDMVRYQLASSLRYEQPRNDANLNEQQLRGTEITLDSPTNSSQAYVSGSFLELVLSMHPRNDSISLTEEIRNQ